MGVVLSVKILLNMDSKSHVSVDWIIIAYYYFFL